jgi:hypothetical protein
MRGVTFAAGATGLYTITMDDAFGGSGGTVNRHHVILTALKATAADSGNWEVVSSPGCNNATGKVITIRHCKTSDGTAVAVGAVSGVFIDIWVSDSGQ